MSRNKKNEDKVDLSKANESAGKNDDLASDSLSTPANTFMAEQEKLNVSPAQSFIAQVDSGTEQKVNESADTPKATESNKEDKFASLKDFLKAYGQAMGGHVLPSDADIARHQSQLQRAIMFAFRQNDAKERIAVIVEHIANDESGAFTAPRLFRGVGEVKVLKNKEESEEFRTIATVLTTLANGNQSNKSFIDLRYVSHFIQDKNKDIVIDVFKTLAGFDTE